MRLTEEEKAMQAGDHGPAVQWAIDHQIKVGRYLGADDFVTPASSSIRTACAPSPENSSGLRILR
jgi:predicted aconitase